MAEPHTAATIGPSLRTSVIAGALVVASLAVGCSHDSSVTGPVTTARRVAVGDTVNGSTISGSPDVHSFAATSGQVFAMPVELTAGRATFIVTDSATGNVVATATFLAPATFDLATIPAFDAGNSVYLVTVQTTSTQALRFRYVVGLVNTAPESNPALMRFGDVVVEPMNSIRDIDDFYFDGAKGDEVILFLQGLVSPPTDDVGLEVVDDTTGTVLASVEAGPGDPDPQTHATGRTLLPRAGHYRVRVHQVVISPTESPYVGDYRLQLMKIDRHPEHVPAALTAGDSVVGESIDYVGDIDEFTMTATAGEEYNFFFQAMAGPYTNSFIFDVVRPDSTLLVTAPRRGTDTVPLLESPTTTFRMPITGTYTIRVRGEVDQGGLYRGPYRLFVYKINRAPEHVSAAPHVISPATVGDTISGESIDVLGDIDEIPVTVTAPTLLHVGTWRLGPDLLNGDLNVLLVRSSDDSVFGYSYLHLPDLQPPPLGGGISTFVIPAGNYTLRVYGASSGRFGYVGGWGAAFQAVDSMPEGRSMLFAAGDTVTGTIDPVGDEDVYRMPVHAGEHYQVHFNGAWQNPSEGETFVGKSDSTLASPDVIVGSSAATVPATDNVSGRIDIVRDGNFHVWMRGAGFGSHPHETGPYHFSIQPFDGRVEHHTSNLAVGDVVNDERFDFAGDWDFYSLSGTAGQELIIQVQSGSAAGRARLRVFDAGADTLITQVLTDFTGVPYVTPHFRIPASGSLRLEMIEYEGQMLTNNPYYLAIVAVNRAPEHIAAAFAVGDTVSGESVDYVGDIDEFTFTGSSGERVRALLDVPLGTSVPWGVAPVYLEITPAGSPTVLGATLAADSTPHFASTTSVITLPSSGTYVVRVRYYDESIGGVPATPFRFIVRDEP